MKIPITKPFFGPEELEAVQKPLQSGWVVQGPYVKEFEDKFAAFTGAKYAAAASSCTTALHMAVAALGLKPGDEVIVPAFTWVATPNVVEYMGAKPVFCDIDLATYNIDVKKIPSLITPRTVGFIPVHLFGLSADMDPILEVAQKHKLWVVEDAACSFGGWYKGKHTGTFGEFGCFSFHPRKSITTGEGGMVVCPREESDRMIRTLRDHGTSRSDIQRHYSSAGFILGDYNALGYNYRMTDIQAALGCVQLGKANEVLTKRAKRAALYSQKLSALDWLKLPFTPAGYTHGNQAYVTLFHSERPTLQNLTRVADRRNALMSSMERKGIATRQGTHAPVIQGFYRNKYSLHIEDFPNAVIADRLSITLPLYPQMTDEEQDLVISTLQQTYKEL